jgi:hypothetical protein
VENEEEEGAEEEANNEEPEGNANIREEEKARVEFRDEALFRYSQVVLSDVKLDTAFQFEKKAGRNYSSFIIFS